MATFLLTWNPDSSVETNDWFEEEVGLATPADPYLGRWSTGSRKAGIEPGDRGYLLRQKRDRGIVGAGTFTSQIYEAEHWDGSAALAHYADISFDCLLDLDDRLPVEVLKVEVSKVSWDRLQGSGVKVPTACEADLGELWARHVDVGNGVFPDELPIGEYPEGSKRQVLVNRYERNRTARAECLRHHGSACCVCGLDFATVYGEIGRHGIHVHHLKELSTVRSDYRVNPVRDLVPVCPNCHAMLHTSRPALTPSQLRKRLQSKRRG